MCIIIRKIAAWWQKLLVFLLSSKFGTLLLGPSQTHLVHFIFCVPATWCPFWCLALYLYHFWPHSSYVMSETHSSFHYNPLFSHCYYTRAFQWMWGWGVYIVGWGEHSIVLWLVLSLLREPVTLVCDLQRDSQFCFPLPLSWDRKARRDWSWVFYFPVLITLLQNPNRSDSGKIIFLENRPC